MSDYKAALNELAEITHNFSDYAEVLLTRGWASLKIKDYQGALKALNKLNAHYKDYYNIEESYFLRAQCYLKLGYFNFAVSEYNRVIKSSENASTVVAANDYHSVLDEQKKKMEELRIELLTLESALLKTIPLRGMERAALLVHDPQLIERTRKKMVHNIMKQRREYNRVAASINKLKKRADKHETREKWEAYAEYGKVRAMYLRETVKQ